MHTSGQHGGGVQVSEGGGGGGVSQVVSRHVDGLDRGNGALLGGGDPLLHATHVSGQGWLVAHSRWNTTQQSGHFRAGLHREIVIYTSFTLESYLSEPEDVVNEEQHILTLLVTEVLGDGQTGQSNTSTSARGLVHLSVHQGDLGSLVLEGDDTTLNHLMIQIVALPGPLADTSEHGETTVSLGNVVDKLHKDGLADSSATKETNLASLTAGGEQVDDLDTSDMDFMLDGHLVKVGSLSVDGLALVGGDGGWGPSR